MNAASGPVWTTVGLLVASNLFMTIAWYGHLRFTHAPLGVAIAASWGIALIEYCLQVPANRAGYLGGLSGMQLKMLQEVITLVVFVGFAWVWLKETPRWNHGVAAVLLLGAVYFIFWKDEPRPNPSPAHHDARGSPPGR